MTYDLSQLVSVTMLLNSLLILWALRPIPGPDRPSLGRTVAAVGVFLLLRVLLGIVTPLAPAWLQPSIKLLPTFVLVRLWKQTDRARAFYFTFLVWVSFTACSNILNTPLLSGIIGGTYAVTGDPALDHLLNILIAFLLHFTLVTLITRLIPLERIYRIGAERWSLMLLCLACELYITYSLSVLRATGFPQLTVYLAILQLFLLGALVLFEKYLDAARLRHQLQVESLSSRYRYQALLERQTAESDLRRLHHDIKNHLLALRRLTSSPTEMERYISTMLQELTPYELLTQTGNALLDGLLTEKITAARKQGIEMTVKLDFRPCNYLEEIDLCSIFGNALDNAIEATQPMAENRTITITGSRTDLLLIVSITNPTRNTFKRVGEHLLTSKADPALHGFGLSSIHHSLQKYDGQMSIDTATPGYFCINLFFPLHPGHEN